MPESFDVTHSEVKGLRLLLVEDSAMIRDTLIGMLQDARLVETVQWCVSAPEAENLIQTATHAFDVAIVDLHLARGFGIDVVKALRTSPLHGNAYILVVTNHTLPAYRQASMLAGANEFLDKSKAFDRIIPLIRQHTSL